MQGYPDLIRVLRDVKAPGRKEKRKRLFFLFNIGLPFTYKCINW